jgi:hypothetical protein
MKVQNKYELVNEEKVVRALEGTQRLNGTVFGGVGEGAYKEDGVWKKVGVELTKEEVDVLESKLLAEYDKLGGMIKVEGDSAGKVVHGSFYDFKSKKPLEAPVVMMQYKINGQFVIIPLGKETGEIKAAKALAEKKETKKKVKKEEIEEEETF